MATLVLSTVGTALGGPVGGAIGALIGQSFDQQLLSPATRGPRLGDLSVQSSSYGTQIPRIYGSMRVAGTVVWSTDLVESEQTTGAKGQPDVTYSYSVSLAVALSSRAAGAIGRIWADGKLLRGAEGDFKVPTTFRFYDGSEDQPIDPLIGSIEGIASTPAYRGIALAVFENLELAAFGNRIPFMTFEVIADPTAPAIGAILSDVTSGAIRVDAAQPVDGYAAYGQSQAAAVQPLIDCFDVRLFDDGSSVRGPREDNVVAIASDELGNGADGEAAPALEREQAPVTSVPSTLRLTYYDRQRDYQTGEARAAAGGSANNEVQRELPAVLSADAAKTIVQQMLAREWARRDTLRLRLPPARIGLEPGSLINPAIAPGTWVLDKCAIEGFVAVAELRPSWSPTAMLTGDGGRVAPNDDIVETPITLALIDAPTPAGTAADGATVLVAASSPDPRWSVRPLIVTGSGQTFVTQTAARKSILGRAITALADAEPFLIDEANSVDVELVDPQQWLTSCDDGALADGANLAVVGSEIVQFANVQPLGDSRFRLSRLLRGRAGSEWASGSHASDELFCLLDSISLRPLIIPAWLTGTELTVGDRAGGTASLSFAAETTRPLAPENLAAAWGADGSLTMRWTRRSRRGFAWLDEIDAPIGEGREQYRITIIGSAGTVAFTSELPALTIRMSDLAPVGPGTASIEIRQLGDWAASRPAQMNIELP